VKVKNFNESKSTKNKTQEKKAKVVKLKKDTNLLGIKEKKGSTKNESKVNQTSKLIDDKLKKTTTKGNK